MSESPKELIAKSVAEKWNGEGVIGLGSGSTAELIVKFLGEKIRSSRKVVYACCTSYRIAEVASKHGFIVISSESFPEKIDWAFDGADEVDGDGNLLKGRGGAMFREKVIAMLAGRVDIAITEDKLVTKLGEECPIPIEVVPFAIPLVGRELKTLGASEIKFRRGQGKYGGLITDQGNSILDVRFPSYSATLNSHIVQIPGVLETGLFYNLTKDLYIGSKSGVKIRSF